MKVRNVEDWEQKICLVGHGEATCSFLVIASGQFRCAKGSVIEALIRMRISEGKMRTTGDNCSGPPSFIVTKQ